MTIEEKQPLCSKRKDPLPPALDGVNPFQFRHVNGCFPLKGHMRSQKIVMSDEKSDKRYGAIETFESVRWSYMVLESPSCG